MKKNLLFVVDEREMGGVSIVLTDLIHFLNKDLFHIDILVLHNRGNMLDNLPEDVNMYFGTKYFDTIDYTIGEVIKMHSLVKLFRKARVVFDLKTGRVKKRIVKERKKIIQKNYDVEIAFKDGYTAIFSACANTPKKIHYLHCDYATNNPNIKYAKLFQEILAKFDYIIGVATNVAKSFNETYHLATKAQVIPIAMDTQRILKLAQEEAIVPIKPNKLNIIVVGRAHPVKGYERMIQVFDKLNNENLMEQVEVHVFGDGPLYTKMVELIHTKNLASKVIMEGNVKNPYAEMKQYDFLLLPSYSEAFGTVISEAHILKVPVLATQTAASEMSIQNGYDGWICANSEEGLYNTLKKLITTSQEINNCKHNLKTFKYDNSKIIHEIERIFKNTNE